MFRKWREARNEEGFTLIELLVVVIIIGILAAIAIPAFLNQRERAWQAELVSAVRNSALDIEAEATALGGTYPDAALGQTTVNDYMTEQLGLTVGDPITVTYVVIRDASDTTNVGFELRGVTTLVNEGVNCQVYDSTSGGIQPFQRTACAAP